MEIRLNSSDNSSELAQLFAPQQHSNNECYSNLPVSHGLGVFYTSFVPTETTSIAVPASETTVNSWNSGVLAAHSSTPESPLCLWQENFEDPNGVSFQSHWNPTIHYQTSPDPPDIVADSTSLHPVVLIEQSAPGLLSSPSTLSESTRLSSPLSDAVKRSKRKPEMNVSPTTASTPQPSIPWTSTPEQVNHMYPSLHLGPMHYSSGPFGAFGSSVSSPALSSGPMVGLVEDMAVNATSERRQSLPESVALQMMYEKTKLKRNRRKKNSPSKHVCEEPECNNRVFTRQYNLMKHRSRKHNPNRTKPFICDELQCGWGFDRQTDLQRHQQSKHLTEKPFVCDLCERSFSRSDTLRRHFKQSCYKNSVQRSSSRAKRHTDVTKSHPQEPTDSQDEMETT